MGSVIRPDFGRKGTGSGSSTDDTRTVFAAVHVFGEARGCRVSIIHDEDDPLGDVLKVVVGEVGSDEVEAVGIVPATREGKREAVTVGLAVLRTLELLESLDSSVAPD